MPCNCGKKTSAQSAQASAAQAKIEAARQAALKEKTIHLAAAPKPKTPAPK